MTSSFEPPLKGIRVVELTHTILGPSCGMILADLGAEVIKVEPVDGDPTRLFGPFRSDDAQKRFGGYFQSTNRNKKSLALDLKAIGDAASVAWETHAINSAAATESAALDARQLALMAQVAAHNKSCPVPAPDIAPAPASLVH